MIDEVESLDPAAELTADIESAIEKQQPSIEQEPSAEDTRPRDEKGRFAKTEHGEGQSEEVEEPQKPAKEAQESVSDTEATKTVIRPPPGFSVASKSAWDKEAPTAQEWAATKADIAKREQEVDSGFKRYSGIGQFAQEAERNGTSLRNALSDYVAVEGALRQDFVGGVEYLCQRLGIDPRALAYAMATKYGGGEQQASSPAAPTVNPNVIAAQVAQMVRHESEQRDSMGKVAAFASDPKYKYFDNLRPDMAKLLQAGKAETLEQAYEAACWLHPEIRSALIKEANGGSQRENAISRSRNAAKAVGGSPTPGVNPDSVGKRHNLSLDEEIRAAIDAQMNAG